MCSTVPTNQQGSVNAQRDMDMVSRVNRGLKPRFFIPTTYKDEDGNIRGTSTPPMNLLEAMSIQGGGGGSNFNALGLNTSHTLGLIGGGGNQKPPTAEQLEKQAEYARYKMSEISQKMANNSSAIGFIKFENALKKHQNKLKNIQAQLEALKDN